MMKRFFPALDAKRQSIGKLPLLAGMNLFVNEGSQRKDYLIVILEVIGDILVRLIMMGVPSFAKSFVRSSDRVL